MWGVEGAREEAEVIAKSTQKKKKKRTVVGAAASAIGNVGPAFGEFGPTDNYALLNPIGKWMLSFCMLLGRLEIFAVLVLFTKTFWRS